jgi:hypothetical protein
MANDVTHNPLILDTAAVISATNKYVIKKIVFRGALAGDDAVLENGAGQVIARLTAPAATSNDELDFAGDWLIVDGLELASIAASGVVYVYCG